VENETPALLPGIAAEYVPFISAILVEYVLCEVVRLVSRALRNYYIVILIVDRAHESKAESPSQYLILSFAGEGGIHSCFQSIAYVWS